ncbi:MAG TPA: hypothetical protein VF668_12020 [Pyrinomonadaceae bacterium]|jgi:hypothetical protein
MGRKLCAAAALALLLCAAARAQPPGPSPPPAPFDAFGDRVYETDWLARLDSMAVEMMNRPYTKAFIVAYGVPNRLPGWPLRRANWAFGVLTKGRGLAPERVEVVFGGYRDEVKYEHWLMPAGERPPVEPFDFAAALTREKTAYKFDQFLLYDPETDWIYDGGYSEYLDARGRYGPLALALRHDPAARAFVVVHASLKNRAGADRRLAADVKRAILEAHALAPGRVVAVGGGRRQHRGVEIWIVPPGAPLPKPSPAPRPSNRKRR